MGGAVHDVPSRSMRVNTGVGRPRISELAGQNRTDVARWATDATAEFRKRNEAIGALFSAQSEAVQREAEALGIKSKH